MILLLLVLLSASMSTLAALVLVSSSAVVKDFYAGFIARQASDRTLTLLMRLSSLAFVLLSVVLALLRPATIVTILGISWGAIGSVFIGPFVWGLCWKRVNRNGAVVASVASLVVCLGLYFYGVGLAPGGDGGHAGVAGAGAAGEPGRATETDQAVTIRHTPHRRVQNHPVTLSRWRRVGRTSCQMSPLRKVTRVPASGSTSRAVSTPAASGR